jgi:hypothetical protein
LNPWCVKCEAAVQGRLGDVEALRIHVANGLDRCPARPAAAPGELNSVSPTSKGFTGQNELLRRERPRVTSPTFAPAQYRRC